MLLLGDIVNGVKAMMNQKCTADLLGVTRWTLANWRRQQQGPPYLVVNRRYYYAAQTIEDWLKSSASRSS